MTSTSVPVVGVGPSVTGVAVCGVWLPVVPLEVLDFDVVTPLDVFDDVVVAVVVEPVVPPAPVVEPPPQPTIAAACAPSTTTPASPSPSFDVMRILLGGLRAFRSARFAKPMKNGASYNAAGRGTRALWPKQR